MQLEPFTSKLYLDIFSSKNQKKSRFSSLRNRLTSALVSVLIISIPMNKTESSLLDSDFFWFESKILPNEYLMVKDPHWNYVWFAYHELKIDDLIPWNNHQIMWTDNLDSTKLDNKLITKIFKNLDNKKKFLLIYAKKKKLRNVYWDEDFTLETRLNVIENGFRWLSFEQLEDNIKVLLWDKYIHKTDPISRIVENINMLFDDIVKWFEFQQTIQRLQQTFLTDLIDRYSKLDNRKSMNSILNDNEYKELLRNLRLVRWEISKQFDNINDILFIDIWNDKILEQLKWLTNYFWVEYNDKDLLRTVENLLQTISDSIQMQSIEWKFLSNVQLAMTEKVDRERNIWLELQITKKLKNDPSFQNDLVSSIWIWVNYVKWSDEWIIDEIKTIFRSIVTDLTISENIYSTMRIYSKKHWIPVDSSPDIWTVIKNIRLLFHWIAYSKYIAYIWQQIDLVKNKFRDWEMEIKKPSLQIQKLALNKRLDILDLAVEPFLSKEYKGYLDKEMVELERIWFSEKDPIRFFKDYTRYQAYIYDFELPKWFDWDVWPIEAYSFAIRSARISWFRKHLDNNIKDWKWFLTIRNMAGSDEKFIDLYGIKTTVTLWDPIRKYENVDDYRPYIIQAFNDLPRNVKQDLIWYYLEWNESMDDALNRAVTTVLDTLTTESYWLRHIASWFIWTNKDNRAFWVLQWLKSYIATYDVNPFDIKWMSTAYFTVIWEAFYNNWILVRFASHPNRLNIGKQLHISWIVWTNRALSIIWDEFWTAFSSKQQREYQENMIRRTKIARSYWLILSVEDRLNRALNDDKLSSLQKRIIKVLMSG